MKPSFGVGAAAVCASAVRAGIIASSKRQRDGGAHAAQHRAPRQMFLGDEHRGSPQSCPAACAVTVSSAAGVVLNLNGSLCAIPASSAENR